MLNFLLGDSIARIKVSILHRDSFVKLNNSRRIRSFLKCLLRNGYINSYTVISSQNIIVCLKFVDNKSILRDIKLVSTPRRRIYIRISNLLHYNKNLYDWDILLSTSLGILSKREAIARGVGGLVICKIK